MINNNGSVINKFLLIILLSKVLINLYFIDYGPLRKINKPLLITDPDS